MDAITHTIIALACIASAYYGGRALLIREARQAFGESPELQREIQLMTAIMQRMTQEDEAYIQRTEARENQPLQLELFPDWGRNGQENT